MARHIAEYCVDHVCLMCAHRTLVPMFLGCGRCKDEIRVIRELAGIYRVKQVVFMDNDVPRYARISAFEQVRSLGLEPVWCSNYTELTAVLNDYLGAAPSPNGVFLMPLGVNNGLYLPTAHALWELFDFLVTCDHAYRDAGGTRISGKYVNFLDNRSGAYTHSEHKQEAGHYRVAVYDWFDYAMLMVKTMRWQGMLIRKGGAFA